MSNSTGSSTLKLNSVPFVVAIVAAVTAAKAVDAAVLPTLGYWGAFAVALLTAGIVAGVVHAVAKSVISQKDR